MTNGTVRTEFPTVDVGTIYTSEQLNIEKPLPNVVITSGYPTWLLENVQSFFWLRKLDGSSKSIGNSLAEK